MVDVGFRRDEHILCIARKINTITFELLREVCERGERSERKNKRIIV